MRRTPRRPFVAVILVAVLLGFVGCWSTAPPGGNANPAPVTPVVSKKETAKEPPKDEVRPVIIASGSKLFADWPRPEAALIISGEQLGYLEPCGCTEGQLGGLLRRYELVKELGEQRKWPLTLVDLGSLIKNPATARGGPDQTKIKLNVALKALATMNYSAIALSPEDLKVGVDEAVGQFLNLPGDTLKVVAANVTAAGLEAKVVQSIRSKAGGVSIGITAAVDPEALRATRDPSLDLLTIRPIDDALPAVLADLEKDTDTQVLLVQASPETARALAGKYPGFDIVVATSPFDNPPSDEERLNDGKTLLISVGQKGKYAGVVGVFADSKQKYRYQRVSLGKTFNGPAKAMKAIVEDEYRETLKGQAIVENFPRHSFINAKGATFVGAENCRYCHENTYNKWSTTKHARAYESLEKDKKPNVVFDAECVSCHTTGFEYDSGWKSPELTAFLKGNQCENCHGPGSEHCKDPDNANYLATLRLTAEQADKNRLCLRCHDEDNSPHFDFAKYYGQIVHKGLDDLKKPEFHKGRPATTAGAGKDGK